MGGILETELSWIEAPPALLFVRQPIFQNPEYSCSFMSWHIALLAQHIHNVLRSHQERWATLNKGTETSLHWYLLIKRTLKRKTSLTMRLTKGLALSGEFGGSRKFTKVSPHCCCSLLLPLPYCCDIWEHLHQQPAVEWNGSHCIWQTQEVFYVGWGGA